MSVVRSTASVCKFFAAVHLYYVLVCNVMNRKLWWAIDATVCMTCARISSCGRVE
jgi:hypothetical protein